VKELVVAVRKILADEHHSDAQDGVEKAGHKVSPSPRGIDASLSCRSHAAEDQRHQKLSHAAAKVAPSSGSGISETNALAVEHARHPKLAGHERGEAEPDSHAANEEAGGGGDVGHAEAERGREQQNDGQAVPGPDDVTDGAHDDACADRTGHGGEAGRSEVRLCEFEVLSDDGDHGRRGESRHEGHKEAHPGHVEGRMVREVEGEDIEALRLVFTIHRDAKFRFREVSRHDGRFSLGVELLGGRVKEVISDSGSISLPALLNTYGVTGGDYQFKQSSKRYLI